MPRAMVELQCHNSMIHVVSKLRLTTHTPTPTPTHTHRYVIVLQQEESCRCDGVRLWMGSLKVFQRSGSRSDT